MRGLRPLVSSFNGSLRLPSFNAACGCWLDSRSSLFLSLPLASSSLLSPPPKKCGFENKCILTFGRSASPKKPPTLRRKNPQTPRKNFLSNVKKFISEVKMPFFWPKKEEKTRCLWAFSSSLVQRYNIFRRNPNRVNSSQHFINSPFAAICSRRGLACCILRGAFSGAAISLFFPSTNDFLPAIKFAVKKLFIFAGEYSS